MSEPLVSVVVPTFRRLPLLRRAIQSVMAQTLRDFELVVSDDEAPAGETWRFLGELAASDARVRVLQNAGPHGQCGNVNSVLRAARGTWIKPLFDDDRLLPQCLEHLTIAAARAPSAVLVSCGAHHYFNGRLVKTSPRAGRPRLELIERRHVLLGMYLQDDVGGGMPTQVMVHRRCIDAGVLFEAPPGIYTAVDSLWMAKVAQHGDSLLVNEPLVEAHQGAHQSVTSVLTARELDREGEVIRRLQLAMIDPALRPPPLDIALQTLRLIRAAHRLRRRQPLEAARLGIGAWHPRAWWLAVRWLLRQSFPGRFHEMPRHVLS